ncbi:hypothetical protein [Accumulibacter sp.]|uniref:hypothetical protein n=1 Tax=Candidatus Accumulibacter TaxID=327159 RepID=UPI0019024C43|nr:hypothetical protein [Accumulibacter sp.]MBN8495371.1 hypothetical protein [Accumulibacter sp.]MBO3713994.1 hypothetical protein [Accumulibacter sp.]
MKRSDPALGAFATSSAASAASVILSHNRRLPSLFASVVVVLMPAVLGCGVQQNIVSIPKTDSIAIVDTEGASIYGSQKIDMTASPPRIILREKGRYMLFRVDRQEKLGDVQPHAGEVYVINDALNLEKVGTFDATKTDDQLRCEFLKPDSRGGKLSCP